MGGSGDVVARLNFCMPDFMVQWTSKTVLTCLSQLWWVAVKVVVYPSSKSCSMDMRDLISVVGKCGPSS